MEWTQPAFWLAAWQIVVINVVLSGDNAVVIALACRTLPPRQRLGGIVLGAGAAVLLRILFTLVVTSLMALPALKLVGGAVLLWIAIKLLAPEQEEKMVAAGDNLWRAVKIVAVADILMSLDNVIAIAAAAKGNWPLIIMGLGVSVPLIVAGSSLLVALLDRYPVLVWGGAGLLGWVGGEIMMEDPVVMAWVGEPSGHAFGYAAAFVGAGLVVGTGYLLALRRRLALAPASSVEL